jgi:peptidyl-prolyl cis-trans isomerase D
LIDNYIQYQQYQQFFGMDVSAQLQSIEAQINSPELVGQSVLDEMISEEIIRLEVAKRGITISEEELDTEIEAGFNFYPNGTPTASLTPTAFTMPTEPEEMLQFITATPEPTGTPLATATTESAPPAETQPVAGTPAEGTPEAESTPEPTATATMVPSATPTLPPVSSPTPLPTATAYTREGFENEVTKTSENLSKFGLGDMYYREFFELNALTNKLKEVITADVQAFEEQVRARHILVADEQTAKDVIARLQAGEDFAELAGELSTDTGSAVQGGDLGWFGKGMMVPEFETAAYNLQNPGDFTTEPVVSQFGYHIIQLLGKMERPLTADELQSAKDAAFREWLAKAREEDYTVETFDVWQARVPSEPNFITAATEAAVAQQTSQAETVSTLDATTPDQ